MFSRLHHLTTATLLFALTCIPAQAEQFPFFFGRETFESRELEDGTRKRAIAQTPPSEEIETPVEPNEETTPSEETETPVESSEETPPSEEIETPVESNEETPPSEETETPVESSEEPPPSEEIETPVEPNEETTPSEEIETPVESNEETTPNSTEIDSTNWEEFTSTRGSFAISFPGTPAEQIEPADPTQGTLETGAYTWESEANPIAYGIFYKILPSAPNTEQVSSFFDDFREDFISEGVIEGQLLEERPIEIDRYPGREILVEGAEGYVKARVYLVNERLYLLIAIAPNQTELTQVSDRFLDSFQLITN